MKIARLGVAVISLFPYVMSLVTTTVVSARLAIVVTLLLVLAFGAGPRSEHRSPPGAGLLAGIAIATIGTVAVTLLTDGSVVATANLQRFLVTFPLAFLTGVVIARDSRLRSAFVGSYLWVSIAAALLSVIERVTATSMFGRGAEFEWLVRDGEARALLGAEHSLVLGVLIAAAIPIASRIPSPRMRLLLNLILICGVFSTDSRGALGIAIIVAILSGFSRIRTIIGNARGWAVVIVAAASVALVYFSNSVWRPMTYSLDWSANSLEYRAAIYSLLPPILAAAPLGYGPGSLPTGIWFIAAPDRVIDISRSVDSQLVLSAMRLGYLGLLLLVAALAVSIAAMRTSRTFALSAASVTLAGAFVALDAWDGLGSVWMLVVGLALGNHLRLRARPPQSRIAAQVLQPAALTRSTT